MKFALAKSIGAATVRPLAGAGIEIEMTGAQAYALYVRPLAGAGIEMDECFKMALTDAFAPSRGRELK